MRLSVIILSGFHSTVASDEPRSYTFISFKDNDIVVRRCSYGYYQRKMCSEIDSSSNSGGIYRYGNSQLVALQVIHLQP